MIYLPILYPRKKCTNSLLSQEIKDWLSVHTRDLVVVSPENFHAPAWKQQDLLSSVLAPRMAQSWRLHVKMNTPKCIIMYIHHM